MATKKGGHPQPCPQGYCAVARRMDTLLLFSPLEIEDMKFMVGRTRTVLSKGDKGIVYSLVLAL
jgi:hypothetical protein